MVKDSSNVVSSLTLEEVRPTRAAQGNLGQGRRLKETPLEDLAYRCESQQTSEHLEGLIEHSLQGPPPRVSDWFLTSFLVILILLVQAPHLSTMV